MAITELIKEREGTNVNEIYIYINDSESIVYDVSALNLQKLFPELKGKPVLCVDNNVHLVIVEFRLEEILKKLMKYFLLVSDEYILVKNITFLPV